MKATKIITANETNIFELDDFVVEPEPPLLFWLLLFGVVVVPELGAVVVVVFVFFECTTVFLICLTNFLHLLNFDLKTNFKCLNFLNSILYFNTNILNLCFFC